MSTRSLIIIGSLLVILMGAAGFGLAYAVSHASSGTASVTPTPTTIATTPATTKTKNKNKNKNYTGTIQSVGANSFVMTQSGKKAKTLTVIVSDQTTYTSSTGGTITFSDLKPGDQVTVKGSLSGQTLTATSITVT
ncbi:MAG TPA: DUF5666 domain-containing protein [Ktedonobacteraceae bacterium]|jgi:archaellum component FlaG (FlaF/FlaG flagellin family)|nr:DUF5666 domain-containing protein [Ktedonobacteraceae bacterium]